MNEALIKGGAIPASRKYSDELFLCLRLHPDMLAKSYEPETLFVEVPDLKNVGSRSWRPDLAAVAQTARVRKQRTENSLGVCLGRLLFVQSTEEGFRRLLAKLYMSPRFLPRAFQEDVQKIEEISYLRPEEQILGFRPDWTQGRVEIVLHPSRRGSEEQTSFLSKLFDDLEVPRGKSRTVFYRNGPAFISAVMTKASLDMVAACNPLRTIHPLEFSGLPDLRSARTYKAPPKPIDDRRSTIKVGVFDGGVDVNCPHLKGFVEEDVALSIKTKPSPAFISHGTAVAGAVLYGPLEKHEPNKPLPAPAVSVVSIRALPPADTTDFELYECIDVIENAVPSRPDIAVYNLSFGPTGPILDDTISRFTYVLDHLSINNDVLFFVAVGNDGEDPAYSRIQSPADLVHGVGVGAYTVRNGARVRAPYSCKGPGREGAKMKPDFAAFGGCTITPMHLLSTLHGMKILESGTSFATPLAASLGAQANGLYDRSTPLLTRALLTHCADHPSGEIDYELGHGCIPEKVEDILNCSTNSVTIAYQGELIPKSLYKLVIPMPENLTLSGNVSIRWTVAAMCPIEINHPGDYTSCCVEDTFYPHSEVYSFAEAKGGKTRSKKFHIRDDKDKIASLGRGWRKSAFPAPRSGNCYPTEQEKRAVDYKWDTLVRRAVSLRADSLHKPFLVLHAIARHSLVDRFPYAAVVTISASGFAGDLHNEIVRRFPVLQPIRIRTESEIRVRI
jgi:hypothetical protein